jgi:Flp pilus assembly protein TadG
MRRLSERGQTAVEFALVIPIMLLFVLGIFEVGRAYFNNESLQTSARDGARTGALYAGDTPAQIQTIVQTAVWANATGLTKPTVVATCIADTAPPTGTTPCIQNNRVDVVVTYPYHIGVLSFGVGGTLTAHTQLRFE